MAYINFKPSSHFKLNGHTGTGSSQTVTGVGFSSALSWLKGVDMDTQNYTMFDTVRGTTQNISSSSHEVEAALSNGLTAWNSDGYVLGGDNGTNANNEDYLGMNWKGDSTSVPSGSTVTNVTCNINATAGIGIYKFNNDNPAGKVLKHGLGKTPQAIWTKNLDSGQDWACYHQNVHSDISTAGDYYLRLNGNHVRADDSGKYHNTVPTATDITFATDANVGGNASHDILCIAFTSIKGYSKFGGFRGNGSATEGFYQPLGFSPALVIVKKASASAAWYMWNGVYQGYNPKNNALFPYHTSQQSTTERIDLLSNGFKFYHSDADHNATGQDFVYHAWASNPIVGSNGTAGTAK